MKENQLIDRIKDQFARYEHWVAHLTELDSMEMEALLLLRDEIEENMWHLSNPFMELKGVLRRVDNELQQQATLCSIKLDGYFVNKTNPPSSAWWWHLFDTSDNADADSFGSLNRLSYE
jgi:hypothetical protein